MSQGINAPGINTNANNFEELATSLASLASLMRGGDMGAPIAELERLYKRALQQPPCYKDVNEMTGQSLNSNDRRSGQGAWLLQNIEGLKIYGVHSLLWHVVRRVYKVPLIDQVARALNTPSRLSQADLQQLGTASSIIDVLGLKDNEIWLVQAMLEKTLIDSATTDCSFGARGLFKSRVFNAPVLEGAPLATLGRAEFIMRKAFPDSPVRTLCLVMHTVKPDFELYHVEFPKIRTDRLVLDADAVRKNSLLYEEQIKQDHESLWTLPDRLDDDVFRGLPPCRGGRTLGILASMAVCQLETTGLLLWKERQFIDRLQEDFGLDIPRDKVRHDLVDRLAGQGFIRKWENYYHLTTRGIARYLYCLAKYTTRATRNPLEVVDECVKQRDRVLQKCGFV